MKKLRLLLLIAMVINITTLLAQRRICSINDSWKFMKGDVNNVQNQDFNDSGFETVSIPHTWNAVDSADEVPGYYRGVGWYRKSIVVDKSDLNKQVYIYFEGANQETELFVNGKSAGKHLGGYGRFCFDITPYVKEGANVFAIKVDNSYNADIPPLSADFTFFGGIYRDLYLIYTPKTHISTTHYASSGVYISTIKIAPETAEVNISVFIENKSDKANSVKLKNVIVDPKGNQVAVRITDYKIGAWSRQQEIEKNIVIKNPQLWDIDNPNLYTVYTSVIDAKGNELDVVANPLGIRWFSFDANEGFFLNRKHVKLIGTNRHQDFLGKGNALRDEMPIRDVKLLKEMGGNFLRVSHYPQDPVVIEMCDKLGIVTSVEIPVVNAITDSPAFNDNCIETTREMVYQNFNNPSVAIWAYMNEVMLRPPYNKEDKEAEQAYFKATEKIANNIEAEIRKIDWSRFTMLPCHGNPDIYENSGLTKIPMILGWNLYQGWYSGNFDGFDIMVDALHKRFDKPMIITEYGADADARLHSFVPERFDFTAEFGNVYHEHYIKAIMERKFIAGANIWNLNDFYSEGRLNSLPHVNLKGITGLDRTVKDSYNLYKARFNPRPMVTIGNRDWTIRGGVADSNYQCIQSVKIYTNATNEVEVSLNGKFLGVKKAKDNIAQFDIPFVDGENLLVARSVIDGTEVTDVLKIDFRLIGANLKDPKLPFRELNMMLGSNRYYEDRVGSMIWLPEREYTKGSWGYVGGEAARVKTKYGNLPSADVDIIGSEDDAIFQTQRKNMEALRFDVPDGEYSVYLYFAEFVSKKQKEVLAYNLGNDAIREEYKDRLFNVSLNGQVMLKDFNIAEQFGEERAVIQKFIVTVRNNEGININFGKVSGEPVVNAVRIYKMY